ncbi:hypothetical protein ES703_19512 [subsurface metagenome]
MSPVGWIRPLPAHKTLVASLRLPMRSAEVTTFQNSCRSDNFAYKRSAPHSPSGRCCRMGKEKKTDKMTVSPIGLRGRAGFLTTGAPHIGKHEQDTRCKLFKRLEAYLDTLKSKMPALHKLFTAPDEAYPPNFLDIMRGISEMVAFYTDCDQNSGRSILLEEKMSQKNCRFCC